MKKVYYCRKNDFKTKKIYKQLKEEFPDIKFKKKDCIGACKICKCSPFLLINDDVVKSKTEDKLYKKAYKKINKSS